MISEVATTLATEEELHVRAVVDGSCGMILLARPRALNALTTAMVDAIDRGLRRFANDPDIAVVAIASDCAGMFCAGGDIRLIRQARLDGRNEEADDFFAREFALNRDIAYFPKPFVALIDGVCLGGGLGLSIHGRHRVVTEKLVMAMPETAIGYFPDIGASYFLNQLPGRIGRYLGLTGTRLSAADAVYCGLATHFVPHESMAALREALRDTKALEIDATLARFAAKPLNQLSRLRCDHEAIDRCFSADTMEEIVRRLRNEEAEFADATLSALQIAAPMSLRATLTLLRQAENHDLDYCLELELELARQMTRSVDFIEGVRAVLVDKDRRPQWASPVSW